LREREREGGGRERGDSKENVWISMLKEIERR